MTGLFSRRRRFLGAAGEGDVDIGTCGGVSRRHADRSRRQQRCHGEDTAHQFEHRSMLEREHRVRRNPALPRRALA